MASTKLQRTFTTDHGNVYKWTYSFWVKRGSLGSDQAMAAVTYSSSYQSRILFRSDDQLEVFDYRNNSYRVQKKTNRKFRDTSAWYHIVVSNDNTQASADDRTKIYINGVQETSFSTNTQYDQNQKTSFNDDYPNYLGSYGSGDYLDGSMSHFHFIDGTAYAPTEFGETDATTGEWKIKTDVSVTYGTNGFFILKDGNSVTDQSGNSNNFTVGGGTLTKTEDSPSNVFATLNALDNTSQTLSNGNTSGYGVTNKAYRTTLGFQGGKYYWEAKCVTQNTYTMIVGLINETNISNGSYASGNIGTNANGWAYFMQSNQDNGKSWHNNTLGSTYQTISQGDILQIAVDGDAGKIWWGVNGTWVNSGNPANGTNAVFTNVSTDQILFPSYSAYNGSGGNPLISFNFGNGTFGTTAISSAGTNASGNGIFEYDVPTGFTALSTKGLNL